MMATCRLCGIDFQKVYAFLPAWYVVDELCSHCNWRYARFYEKRTRSWREIKLDDLILTEFVTERLRQLAERYRDGKSITRCEIEGYRGRHRCSYYGSEKIEGHRICTHHAKVYRSGKFRFVDQNAEWYDQVTKFFYDTGWA